ncbi:MAG TPA: hypothetical protein VH575_23480 [Gemmataceae bacterium]|jgi:hypothetical protein
MILSRSNSPAIGSQTDLDRVRFHRRGTVVAEHPRCWGKGQVTFEPLHYLALLERKPGALDYARPLAGWSLPDAFTALRRRLEHANPKGGTRQYIRVLRVLETYDLTAVVAEPCAHRGVVALRIHRPPRVGPLAERPRNGEDAHRHRLGQRSLLAWQEGALLPGDGAVDAVVGGAGGTRSGSVAEPGGIGEY